MYKAKLWDEDKWNIHSSSYNSSKYENAFEHVKEEDRKYNEQKYGSGGKDVSSDYIKIEQNRERDDKDRNPGIFDNLEEEKNNDAKDDDVPFKSVNRAFEENKTAKKPVKQAFSSIEDAIKRAIEEEKKLIVIDY